MRQVIEVSGVHVGIIRGEVRDVQKSRHLGEDRRMLVSAVALGNLP